MLPPSQGDEKSPQDVEGPLDRCRLLTGIRFTRGYVDDASPTQRGDLQTSRFGKRECRCQKARPSEEFYRFLSDEIGRKSRSGMV